MGAFLDKPKVEKTSQSGEGCGLRYGLSSMQGWRVEMEDSHCARLKLGGKLNEWSLFGVFDGHAGSKTSEYCSEQLETFLMSSKPFIDAKLTGNVDPLQVPSSITKSFLSLDSSLRDKFGVSSDSDKSGSTAICMLVSPSHLYLVNCGDSRAIHVRNNEVFTSTTDHKPTLPCERERIVGAGGTVIIQRVNGSLAVSRSFGDFEYKNVNDKGPLEQLVSVEPDTLTISRDAQDQFVVLACDGIWDVMSNEDVCQFVTHRLKITHDLESICEDILDTCLHKYSKDNMTVILVTFCGIPKLDPVAQKQDELLNKCLEELINEIKEENPNFDGVQEMISLLSTKNLPALPPGGGLASKQNLIESIVDRMKPSSTRERTAMSSASSDADSHSSTTFNTAPSCQTNGNEQPEPRDFKFPMPKSYLVSTNSENKASKSGPKPECR